MGKGVYIPDGYNETAYVAAKPGVHDSLRFSFRPMVSVERARHAAAAKKLFDLPEKYETFVADTIKARVLEWDAEKSAGVPVPLETAEILKLRPDLLARAYLIVIGAMITDDDPDATHGNLEADQKN